MFNYSSIGKLAVALTFASALAGPAQAEIYKGETANPGAPTHTIFVTFANQALKGGVEIQVNAGQTLTKSMLKGAKGQIDFFSTVPALSEFMAGGQRMYKEIKDAPELSKNLRAILGFKAGIYNPITLASSGIENWDDIKGKTVFTGPPSGGATATAEALIKNVTGYVAGEDYKAVRLSWGEGGAALADRKIDMMIRPAEIGSAIIQQFGLSGEFRILSIPEDVVTKPGMKAIFGSPGRGVTTFDGSAYKGQLTEGTITALGYNQYIGTQKDVSEEIIYNATKAFWENLEEVRATAFFLRDVSKETAFISINIPLHPGALRYYDEAGFDVPAELRPSN